MGRRRDRGAGATRRARDRVAVAVLLLAACTEPDEVVRGRGALVQQRRTFRPVEEVVVRGDVDLAVRVIGDGEGPLPRHASGVEAVLLVEAPEDLLHLVEVAVEGDRLFLGPAGGVRLDPVPSIELTVSRLRSLTAEGRGEVRVAFGAASGFGAPMVEAFALRVTGSVDVRATGAVGSLSIEQAGSGDLHLGGLGAGALHHRSRGSGDAWVWVNGPVEVDLEGSGDLHLSGEPRWLARRERGSGEVLLRGAANGPR